MALVYSCCFWFSLRLAGILIGIFSLFQTVLLLAACCWAYNHTKAVKSWIIYWINHFSLMYMKKYFEDFSEVTPAAMFFKLGHMNACILRFSDKNRICSSAFPIGFLHKRALPREPSKNIVFLTILLCIYALVCLLFIYGAYMCNNVLMVAYILLELFRLAAISTLVAAGLLLLKQNIMDIGILIGASVAGGFLLLGLFYLWICAASLPVLINEMERDDQNETITKLRKLLEAKNQPDGDIDNTPRRAFDVPQNRMRYTKSIAPALIPVGY